VFVWQFIILDRDVIDVSFLYDPSIESVTFGTSNRVKKTSTRLTQRNLYKFVNNVTNSCMMVNPLMGIHFVFFSCKLNETCYFSAF
jgi:hypothetical protein